MEPVGHGKSVLMMLTAKMGAWGMTAQQRFDLKMANRVRSKNKIKFGIVRREGDPNDYSFKN
jgi:hypothetical protein